MKDGKVFEKEMLGEVRTRGTLGSGPNVFFKKLFLVLGFNFIFFALLHSHFYNRHST